MPPVVLDTNILVTALRSKLGASFQVLSAVGTGKFDITLSVPLILEYEEILLRERNHLRLSKNDIQNLLDYLCRVAFHQDIFYLWRPILPDPQDDHILELAIAAGCRHIITYNRRDFVGAKKFGLKILTPAEFLVSLGELK